MRNRAPVWSSTNPAPGTRILRNFLPNSQRRIGFLLDHGGSVARESELTSSSLPTRPPPYGFSVIRRFSIHSDRLQLGGQRNWREFRRGSPQEYDSHRFSLHVVRVCRARSFSLSLGIRDRLSAAAVAPQELLLQAHDRQDTPAKAVFSPVICDVLAHREFRFSTETRSTSPSRRPADGPSFGSRTLRAHCDVGCPCSRGVGIDPVGRGPET